MTEIFAAGSETAPAPGNRRHGAGHPWLASCWPGQTPRAGPEVSIEASRRSPPDREDHHTIDGGLRLLGAGLLQQVQEKGLNGDRNPRIFPADRSFQRFRNFRRREFPSPRGGDDILPHRRQRLAGMEWPLDDDPLGPRPPDDLVDGLGAAIAGALQVAVADLSKQAGGWSPSALRRS